MPVTELPPDTPLDPPGPKITELPPAAKLDHEAKGFWGGLKNAAESMIGQLDAGRQGTSPVVKDLQGNRKYNTLGPVFQTDFGPAYSTPDGQWQRVDPTRHVLLKDPDTGEMTVFERNKQMEEGRASSLGRVLGVGAIASAPTRLASNAAPSAAQNLVKDFQALDVPPTLPAVAQDRGVSGVANTIKDSVVGAPMRKGMDKSLEATAGAAERTAAAYGEATTPRAAGQAVRRGAESFVKGEGPAVSVEDALKLPTRSLSFSRKAEALYNDLDRFVKPETAVGLDNTKGSLQGISGRFASNPEFGKTLQEPKFADWLAKLDKGENLSWGELKEFRAYVGRKLSQPSVTSDIPRADWENLYGGISRDLGAAAQAAGPEAALAFRRADGYYAAGRKRIEDTLKNVMQADSPEKAFAMIDAAASNKGSRADLGKLLSLKRSMPKDEWGDVASAYIRQMGKPTAGASDPLAGAANWSPTTFVTNFERLAPEAKEAIFSGPGMRELRASLDQLTRVAAAQKNVEKMRNTSNTAGGLGNMGLVAGLTTAPLETIMVALSTGAAGAAMVNPTFVRWLTAANNAKTPAQFTSHLSRLGQMARSEPDLMPAYQAIAGGQQGGDAKANPAK